MHSSIKFRVWSKELKSFKGERGFYSIGYNGMLELRRAGLGGDCENGKPCYNSSNWPLREEDYVIQQYSGVRDKEGKEIYCGDIVKYMSFLTGDWVYFPVEWSAEGCWNVYQSRYCSPHIDYFVVGNIFENEDLLP